jgi:hypothetical protein
VDIIKKIATSTMPAQRMDALNALMAYQPGEWTKTRDIAGAMHYPTSTTKEILEDLVALRLVEQDLPARTQTPEEEEPKEAGERKRDTTPYAWRLAAETRTLIQNADVNLGERHVRT